MAGWLSASAKKLCDWARLNELLVARRHAEMLVLTYHGVLSRRRPNPENHANEVDADSFRLQLGWLLQRFEPTDLAGLERFGDGLWQNEKPPLLITFDDGYRNNLTVAAPILREAGAPAIFFLTTGYVGTTRVLWNDEVRARVFHWPELEIAMPFGGRKPVPREPIARRAFGNRITRDCKQLPDEQRLAYLDLLREKAPSVDCMDDLEVRAFMSWDEARDLAQMGFELGSHTVEHPILSQATREKAFVELHESKAAMEREIQRPCRAIAYPNGTVRDVSDSVFEQARLVGYDWAFMTTPVWHARSDDPLKIPRIGVPGHTDLATFKFYASGLHTRLSSGA